jgi:hypothetical protein
MVKIVDVTEVNLAKKEKKKKIKDLADNFFNSIDNYRFLVGDGRFGVLSIEVETKNNLDKPRISEIGYCDMDYDRFYLKTLEFKEIISDFAKEYEQEILGIPEKEKGLIQKVFEIITSSYNITSSYKKGMTIQTDYS